MGQAQDIGAAIGRLNEAIGVLEGQLPPAERAVDELEVEVARMGYERELMAAEVEAVRQRDVVDLREWAKLQGIMAQHDTSTGMRRTERAASITQRNRVRRELAGAQALRADLRIQLDRTPSTVVPFLLGE